MQVPENTGACMTISKNELFVMAVRERSPSRYIFISSIALSLNVA
jgi:hypothetical protein